MPNLVLDQGVPGVELMAEFRRATLRLRRIRPFGELDSNI